MSMPATETSQCGQWGASFCAPSEITHKPQMREVGKQGLNHEDAISVGTPIFSYVSTGELNG